MEERTYDETMLAHVALTQVPRLNSVAYRPLFDRCGGVTGFFRERNEVIGMLLREAHLESVKPERETWLEMGRRELDWMERNGVKRQAVLPLRFRQSAVMSSNVFPLVSGTHFHTKNAAARQMMP